MRSPLRLTVLATSLLAASTLIAASSASAQMGYSSPPPSNPNMPPSHSQSSSSNKPGHLSRELGPKIIEAQKDIQNKDFKDAVTSLQALQGQATEDFDKYIIDRLLAGAAIGLNDMSTAAAAQEAAASSPAMPDDDKKSVLHDALQLSAYMKQWPQTISYGQQLAQMNALDAQTAGNLAIAYYNTNDFPHAQQFAQQSIQLAKAAGQQPDPNATQIIMSAEVKQGNQAGAEQTLEQMMLQSYSPETLAKLVGATFGARGMSDAQALYLYRLLVVGGAMAPEYYKEMGSLLNVLGYPTEAANVLGQAESSGKVSSAEVGQMLAKARRDAATDERMLPQIAAAAQKSRTGEQEVKLGEDYWGYGRYGDAEAAARAAMAKGGLKQPWEAPMLIGTAEIAQGNYAAGIQTLSQVSGSPAVTQTAHLWSLYAQAKQGPARASTAQPSQSPQQ